MEVKMKKIVLIILGLGAVFANEVVVTATMSKQDISTVTANMVL